MFATNKLSFYTGSDKDLHEFKVASLTIIFMFG